MNHPDQRSAARRRIHRNVWAAGGASFFTDISSEMIANTLPLFLANVLGVRTVTIGLIEGAAESVASLVKLYSGALSDRLGKRKALALSGYAISSLAKPLYALATSWPAVAAIRWADRLGKGVRTAPRDALIADSTEPASRGLAFGLHRAADTAGAVIGLAISIAVVHTFQAGAVQLGRTTFNALVLASIVPAFLAVAVLWIGSRDVPASAQPSRSPFLGLRELGRPFAIFLGCTVLFQLGNSADAFLVLRAQERGMSVTGILWALLAFNLVYTAISTPAGSLSDRKSRKYILLTGWSVYAAVYLGFALAQTPRHIVVLFVLYGVYYGLVTGTAKAVIADMVEPERRATAFGSYHAAVGLTGLPASLLAGLLWQGIGSWDGFGPGAPFVFGALCSILAVVLLGVWLPARRPG